MNFFEKLYDTWIKYIEQINQYDKFAGNGEAGKKKFDYFSFRIHMYNTYM